MDSITLQNAGCREPSGRNAERFTRWFIVSAGILLVITGLAKIFGAFGSGRILNQIDPITRLQFRHLMLGVGALELIAGGICVFSRMRALSLSLVTSLGASFFVYRVGLKSLGWQQPCPCLGNLTDAISISPETADSLSKTILAYLMIGTGTCFWIVCRHRLESKISKAGSRILMLIVLCFASALWIFGQGYISSPAPRPTEQPISFREAGAVALSHAGPSNAPAPVNIEAFGTRIANSNDISIKNPVENALAVEKRATRYPLTEAQLQDTVGCQFDKANWHDAGFQTIAGLVETYYWSLSEGAIARLIGCMTPLHRIDWQTATSKRELHIKQQFATALNDVTGYQIISVSESPGTEYIVEVEHFTTNGARIAERFAVRRIDNEWKIAGVRGSLKYGHHPGVLSKYENRK